MGVCTWATSGLASATLRIIDRSLLEDSPASVTEVYIPWVIGDYVAIGLHESASFGPRRVLVAASF